MFFNERLTFAVGSIVSCFVTAKTLAQAFKQGQKYNHGCLDDTENEFSFKTQEETKETTDSGSDEMTIKLREGKYATEMRVCCMLYDS